jgi:AraC-like DNA-binding protein
VLVRRVSLRSRGLSRTYRITYGIGSSESTSRSSDVTGGGSQPGTARPLGFRAISRGCETMCETAVCETGRLAGRSVTVSDVPSCRTRYRLAVMPFDQESFFAERGISLEVAAARPYVRYSTEDRDPVREAYQGLSVGQRACMTRWAGLADGFLIYRHAPPELDLPHVYPEMRPDVKVATRPPTWHVHSSLAPMEPPENPYTSRLLPSRHVHSAANMRRHIQSKHGGVNVEYVHSHPNEAKYTFCPNGTVERSWADDHDERFTGRPEARARHVAVRHGGVDVAGQHVHVWRRKDREHGIARRLDMHPLAYPLFACAERAFFVIEGCIKADAILSQGEAVFSVPSITLWEAPELGEFADWYLPNTTVFIVADADAFLKQEVMTQAKLCLSFLRRRGVWAYIALPPADRLENGIKGVDDYLGRGGGRLDDLVLLDWQIDEELVWNVVDAAEATSWREDGVRRALSALEGLALHAGEAGELRTSVGSLARVMGVEPKQVQRGIHDLTTIGVVTTDRSLEVADRVWHGNRYVPGPEWAERPTLTLRSDCRATSLPHRRVGDVAGPPDSTNAIAAWRRFWDEFTVKNRYGQSQRDIAILTDYIEGKSIEEAAAPWYSNPAHARRRIPGIELATALRHLSQEVAVFSGSARHLTVADIARETGLSTRTITDIIKRGAINPRWLAGLNERARTELERSVAVIIASKKPD